MKPKHWLLLALAFRLIAARTNLSTGHPDEWFQTVEFGNFLSFGFLSQSGEFLIHMRNLTWPALLALPLRLADFLAHGDIAARMFAVKLTTALLDLSMVAAYGVMLRQERGLTERWRQAGWALFVLPWFMLGEAVRPSQEHLSAIACAWALGLFALTPPSAWASVLAGAALVLTGAFRYPSGLLGVGALVGVLARGFFRKSEGKNPKIPWLLGGVALGLVAGGLADWIFYGRPWESLWMYLQYNVLTGLSTRDFGAQPLMTYVLFFKGYFGGVLIPLGIAATLLAPLGLAAGLRRLEPWAFAVAFFLAGHVCIPHKEPRFMGPILLLVLWACFQGARLLWQFRVDGIHAPTPRWLRRAMFTLGALVLAGNSVFLLRALWGETWRAGSNYLELSSVLKSNPACAVITVRRPFATLLPWHDPSLVPDPPLGFFPAPPHQPSSPSLKDRPVIWMARQPACGPAERVLFQPQKPESFWESEAGCSLLESGVLHWFPRSSWSWLMEKGWVSSPWYSCPSSLLARFARQERRTVIAHRMRHLSELPPPGIPAEEFLRRAWGELDPKDPANRDATFGDW